MQLNRAEITHKVPKAMWLLLFWLFAAILPFSFALNPLLSIDLQIVRVLVLLVFLLWLAHSLANKKILLDNRGRLFLLAGFILICLLSIFWALDQQRALRKTFFILNFLPLYFISFGASQSEEQRLTLAKIFTWSAFVLAIFSLFPFFAQFTLGIDMVSSFMAKIVSPFFLGKTFAEVVLSYPSWMVNIGGKTILRTFGTFPDPHLFSLYLNMLIPLVIWLWKKTKSKKYALAIAVLLLASLLSFSRASYLSLGGALLFIFAFSNTKNFFQKNPLLALFAGFIFISILVIPNPLEDRLLSSFDLTEGSNAGRIEMWKKAAQTTAEFPFFGVGIGNFSRHIEPASGYREPIYAHNLFLDFSSETGIPNALLLLALLLSPVFAFFKRSSLQAKAIGISFVILLVHSIFETPFYSVHILPLVFILLGLKTDVGKNA